MDVVLVLLLILVSLSNGQSYRVTNDSCHSLCPRGYYKVDDCETPAQTVRCEKCDSDTFTARSNKLERCLRCDACGHYEMEVKSCSFDSDVVCECKEGFYNASPDMNTRNCNSCPSKNCDGSDNKTKCPNYQRCLSQPDCRRKCKLSKFPPSTNSYTTPSTAASSPTAGASTNTWTPVVNPVPVNQIPWLVLSWLLVTILGLFWLLLLTSRRSIRYHDCCPCWTVNKHLQPPADDPKSNDQGSSPTTLTYNISEENPMMHLSQSPGPPEDPAYIIPLLPEPEAEQDELSEHWPSIVLYAIIKEVPLRRWKEFLRLLSVAEQQLERVELESGFGVGYMERQYQMLRLWSQHSSANLKDVFSALHYMDLSGCAQQLQESLEKLQRRHGFADHGFIGWMGDS